MALYEGNVSLVTNSKGELQLRPRKEGNWHAGNVGEFVAAIGKLDQKLKLNPFSFWLDMGLPKTEPKPITLQEFIGYVKLADTVELVLVRGKFPAPKIKLTKAGAGTKKAQSVVL